MAEVPAESEHDDLGFARRCWSDCGGEFVECCNNSQVLMSGFGAEFLVAAA